jgi:hypothetical protein
MFKDARDQGSLGSWRRNTSMIGTRGVWWPVWHVAKELPVWSGPGESGLLGWMYSRSLRIQEAIAQPWTKGVWFRGAVRVDAYDKYGQVVEAPQAWWLLHLSGSEER